MKKTGGFAISGVLYPILILVVFLIVEMLTVLGTRKGVLDQSSKKLLETINEENKVYTNEELSELILEQAKKIEQLEGNFLNKTYPIGSIYISNSNTNPGTIFGGTWVAFGSGRTLVGVSTSDPNYNTVEKTGGSNSQSITLTTKELPKHAHGLQTMRKDSNNPSKYDFTIGNQDGSGLSGIPSGVTGWEGKTTYTGAHWFTTSFYAGETGEGKPFEVSHISPYITVYMWKRTA